MGAVMATAVSVGAETPVDSAEYMDLERSGSLVRIQQLLYDDAFNGAHNLSRSFIETHPGDPAGYFALATVQISRMIDLESNSSIEAFEATCDTALDLATRVLDTCSASTAAWMHLFRGHIYSHRAASEAHFGSMLSALKGAFEARNEYQAGLSRDSSCWDLYFGLGMFHYWKSTKAGLLKSLGLFADDTERGIRELYLAADSALISREAARQGLIWVHLNEKMYDSTISACRDMLQKYPNGKLFYWPLGRAICEGGRPDLAVQVYDQLRFALSSDTGTYFNLIECDYLISQCHEKCGHRDHLKTAARRAREYFDDIPSDVKSRQRNKIAYLKRAARL